MDKCLLYLLTFVVLAPNCIRGSTSITVLRDLGDDMLDLSYQHIHLDLRKAKQLNDFEINSAQRNCSQKFLEFWNNLNNNTREAYFDSFGKIGAGILSGNGIRVIGMLWISNIRTHLYDATTVQHCCKYCKIDRRCS